MGNPLALVVNSAASISGWLRALQIAGTLASKGLR